ncbi:hypothetical protein LLS47_22780 [Rouxiella badensis]|uniref:hypothetical protein n=1 Tax=Enterobacterales TaxID=91347 RepID=UPI001C265C2E|nr:MULTISPECIES: hypothetical protein [Enterobacterales]MBU9813368.1 hypothetical protein [Rahnella perminowiae]MBU9823454.1 hypothetical protein [Rahnella perminowiae]MBU9858492.1 hypothetical protein [Rahnella aceris]MBU9863715.1 hypothetical protein [Rahnella aceris]MCC3705148.1 hypothetical protein [Rouxiella badensis]
MLMVVPAETAEAVTILLAHVGGTAVITAVMIVVITTAQEMVTEMVTATATAVVMAAMVVMAALDIQTMLE